MLVTLPHNTLLLLIGPTNSGKSTLVKKLKEDNPSAPLSTVFISSDECRREILGASLHKYDERMLQSSDAAFELLFTKVRASMSFPMALNNSLVVLDTTGLNEQFRDKCASLCKEMNWNMAALVFDYKGGYEEYAKYVPPQELDGNLIRSQLKKLRTRVRPTLRRKDFTAGVFFVPEKNFSELRVRVGGESYIKAAHHYFLSRKLKNKTALVVGDIHGCYDELVELIQIAGFEVGKDGEIQTTTKSPDYIVLVGDLVDKGPYSGKVIDFVHRNLNRNLFLVIGNHDRFFHRHFSGEEDMKEEKRSEWFDSTYSLADDFNRRKRMEEIIKKSSYWFMAPNFLVTHAPCPAKYVGKCDEKSEARMGYMPYPHPKDQFTLESFSSELEKCLSFMKDQSVFNWPFLISGHIHVDEVTKVGTQLMIDTGCAYGNKLSGVIIEGSKFRTIEVKAKRVYKEDRFIPSIFKPNPMKDIELTAYEIRRIRAATSSCPTNFLSGTMAPARSNVEDNVLEDVKEALSYYEQKGVSEVVLQPKWMGSRAQLVMVRGEKPDNRPGVYQHGDAYAYWISRSGFLINHRNVDLSSLSTEMINQHFTSDLDLLILDGELMPWSVLGEGLIAKTFKPVEYGIRTYIEELRSIGFHEGLERLRKEAKESGYMDDKHLSKKERQKKYKPHLISAYEAMFKLSNSVPSIEELEGNLSVYKEQLDLYGSVGEPEFKPFSILKWIKNGKEEVLPGNNYEDFHILSSNKLVGAICIPPSSTSLAEAYFANYSSRGYEGIVVKPTDNKLENIAPALKVRNEDYLTLVYGPNYRHHSLYTKHVQRKRTDSKVKASIKQWQLGRELLSIPYFQLSESKRAKEIIFSFIKEERKSEGLDPRL